MDKNDLEELQRLQRKEMLDCFGKLERQMNKVKWGIRWNNSWMFILAFLLLVLIGGQSSL